MEERKGSASGAVETWGGLVGGWAGRWRSPQAWPRYEDACNMDADGFVEFLTGFLAPPTPAAPQGAAHRLGKDMEASEMAFGYLSGLLAHIVLRKRRMSRSGDKKGHEDMVDAEKCVAGILKAVDMRYRGDSKRLSAYLEELRESKQMPSG